MPPLTVSQRVRQKLFTLFRDRQFSKTKLAAYCRKDLPWLSNFLHPNPKRTMRPSFHLDELDDIAGYFHISIGELLGAAKPGELSGDEQRLVHAFRVLPPAMQEHFLAVIEQMSTFSRAILQKQTLHRQAELVQTARTDAFHGRPLSTSAARDIRERIDHAMVLLGEAASAATADADRSVSGARPDTPPPGEMAR